MDFYQVAMSVAAIYDWPNRKLADKVGIDYNTIRNWKRRKTTHANEFDMLWRALGINPSSLALAASLADDMMEAEVDAYKQASRAIPSPAIDWALSQFETVENIEAILQRKEQGLMNAYVRKLLEVAEPF